MSIKDGEKNMVKMLELIDSRDSWWDIHLFQRKKNKDLTLDSNILVWRSDF